MDTITAFATLLFVMDPLGNVPVFLSALKDVPAERHRRIILRELLIALAVLMVFLFAGKQVLVFLGLSQESIQIAGAIVLFLIAIKMIFPQKGGIMGESIDGEPFIVPLAIPCVAGPSTLAVLMLMANSEGSRTFDWVLALICAWLVSSVILLSATKLSIILGIRGLTAIERLMGMILVIMSVQMMLDGLKTLIEN
ncbi:MAG: multiple antibiotic resistance protein [Lentisphaeria bacterium]|jgi:multiple antibiotic resistance protein